MQLFALSVLSIPRTLSTIAFSLRSPTYWYLCFLGRHQDTFLAPCVFLGHCQHRIPTHFSIFNIKLCPVYICTCSTLVLTQSEVLMCKLTVLDTLQLSPSHLFHFLSLFSFFFPVDVQPPKSPTTHQIGHAVIIRHSLHELDWNLRVLIIRKYFQHQGHVVVIQHCCPCDLNDLVCSHYLSKGLSAKH